MPITTREQAAAHQARHGFTLKEEGPGKTAGKPSDAVAGRTGVLPKPVRMTRPEREYGMILEAWKRRGDIVDYRFQGISLAWGRDPATGILMRYKCDWLVVGDTAYKPMDGVVPSESKDFVSLKVIEVKGAHIFERDLVRFKGCRAEWPMFQFEMHQLKAGEWRRIL